MISFQSKLQQYKVVLGLLSPRRAEIMKQNLGISDFIVVKSQFEENVPKEGLSDIQYVTKTAEQKLPSILEQLDGGNHIVLVADTVILCDGKIHEKPGTADKQMEMLKEYREAETVKVITGVHVVRVTCGKVEKHVTEHVITDLQFNKALPDDTLEWYVTTGEGLSVAGGFQYQSRGCQLFTGLHGDYFNVVGLPVKAADLIKAALA